MSWKVAHACVRGSAHVRAGTPNQDAVESVTGQGNVAVVAVSDGHGGARHFRSQIGSSLAVSTAVSVLETFLPRYAGESTKLTKDGVEQLSRLLVEAWTSSVMSDLAHQPLTAEELTLLDAEGPEARATVEAAPILAYGATLLVTAATDDLILYMQLGDGEILSVLSNGSTKRPLPEDDRLVANQTTSLCQPESWKEFRSAWTTAPHLPALVLLSTDGYANSFRSDDDFLKIGEDYLEILREQGIASLAEELPSILEEATKQGSGDDITLAILQGDLWRTPQEQTPVRPAISEESRSALIAQLKARHSSQARRVDDLETRLVESRRHNQRLRTALIALAVVLAAAGTYYFRDHIPWLHTPATPVLHPKNAPTAKPGGAAPSDEAPTTPGSAATKPPTRWRLTIPEQEPLTLAKGLEINASEILPDGEEKTYARVAELSGKMILINDSQDSWKVKPVGGKAYTVTNGKSIALGGASLEVTFAKGISGKIAPIEKAAQGPASLATPAADSQHKPGLNL